MTAITAKPFTARPLTARPFTAYQLGQSTSVSNPLVWHAAYPDSDGVMQAELIGSGDAPVFSVDSGLLLPDFEGIYRTTAEDTPPWHGARKVTNLLSYSEDFSNAVWTTSNCTVTTGQTDPNGGSTAARITATSINGRLRLGVSGSSTSKTYVNSIWVRRASGSSAVQLVAPDSSTATAAITSELTSEWQRFTVSSAANANTIAYIGVNISLSGEAVDVAFAQQEDVTGQANQNPSEYVPTTSAAASKYFSYENGNTVSSNVVTEAQGATLDPLPSLYAAPSLTNSLTYSNDLTNAAWTKAGTSVAALNAVGITGAPNTATTLTDDNGAESEFAYQVYSVAVSASDVHTTSYRIAKDADTSRFVGLVNGDVLNKWSLYHLNTSTGAITLAASAGAGSPGSQTYEVISDGAFWLVILSGVNPSQARWSPCIIPADGSVFGTRSTAATGSTTVGNVELHLNKTASQVRGSPPLISTGTAKTFDGAEAAFDDSNHNNTQGGYYVEWTPFFSTSEVSGSVGILSLDGGAGLLFYDADNSLLKSTDGTNTASVSLSVTKETTYKLWVAYGDSSLQVGYNSSEGSVATYDGAFTAGTFLDLSNPVAGVALLRSIRRYNSDFAASKSTVSGLASS